ncbi:bifunctional 3-deoxy-7-phosphoheptulonate synthase/chorismate mutase type II [Moheibacter lacus]|uniref:chorismate mutase n=1 Tax=Moheibacter lacus TaxID=2745851 RepID=A0A838ZPL0_9FLAO|nr:bifunctional 3-deoxy-7-phosphoheptulonate synthase/chorismate mutase type II [Moheibacter lacus]MBA5629417.1 bifunctional 3-deoxy-7-phosphoheptulonate synthase/chorismate mutase type II [Moheibacter lacus]
MSQKLNWIKEFDKPLAIAGPCSAESEKQMMEIAEQLNKDYVQVFRAGIWKPRTKPNCFEGVGAIGLNWLKKVKDEFGFKIATEVANASHVKLALEYDVDYLWIGARSTVNPFTVQEIAEALRDTKKVVLVKNPVNPDLELWMGAIERLQQQNIQNLGAIHRGFSTYKKTKYRNNPQWQIALDFMNKMPEIPMVCDPSHICGNREGIFDVSQQAYNFEYDGLMIESHHQPDEAWSDAKQQITPDRLLEILRKIELRKSDDEDAFYHSKINHLRNEIDETDQGILETIAQRMKIASQIGELKKEHNVAVFQPDRWKQIKDNSVQQGEKLGLSEEFIDKLVRAIHQESISHQNQIMNKENSN